MTYFVSVSAYIPYAVTKEYTCKASAMHTAIARSIRQYRVYLRERNNGRVKRVDNLTIKARII